MLLKGTAIGHVGADPELTYTGDGVAMTKFNVATSRGSGDKKETTWVRIVTWRKLAELCDKYVKKGMLVYVEGDESVSAWKGQDGSPHATLEISADEVKFLSRVDTPADVEEESLF